MTSPIVWFCLAVVSVAVYTIVGAPADGESGETCTFNGTTYTMGQDIPIPEDVCLHCECRPGWTGPSETACARIDCPYWMMGFRPPECPMETTPGKCCPDSPCLRKLEEEENSRFD